MTKKHNGNVREGDIREHNPLRKRRINDIRDEEAQQEMNEYWKQTSQSKKNYDDMLKDVYGD